MTETNTKYQLTNLEEKVNGKHLRIVGVEHTPEFFEEHKDFFEDVISEADYVVLEAVLNGDFWECEFYRAVGRIAKSQDKYVYQVDPRNVPTTSLDFGQFFLGFYLGGILGKAITANLKENGISRKTFLKLLCGGGIGASLILGSMPGVGVRYLFNKESLSEYGPDDSLNMAPTIFFYMVGRITPTLLLPRIWISLRNL